MRGFLQFSLARVLFFPVLLFTLWSSVSCTEEIYVSDRYGNVVYRDGTVRYIRPLPVGNATYSTKLEYDAEGLNILYASARSFVQDVQPTSFPFDLLEVLVNGSFVISNDYKMIIEHYYGLTTCIVVGVLFVVAFIVGGICFCCCRCCCGNCGGDEVQRYSKDEGCMRMGLSLALFLMLGCVFSGAVCVYVTNQKFTDALTFTNTTMASNIDDIDLFLKNTGREFQYLVTDMYDVIHGAFQKDLYNLGEVTKGNIFDNLNVNEVVEDTMLLDLHFRNLSKGLSRTMTDISSLQTAALRLESALENLADAIDNTVAGCPSDCSPNLCGRVVTSDLRNGAVNTTSLPNLNSTAENVEQIILNVNFTSVAVLALRELDGIATAIDDIAGDVVPAVNTSLVKYRELIHSMADGVFKLMTEAFPKEDLKEQTTSIFSTVGDYDDYRVYFGLILVSVFIGLVILFCTGMLLGICYFDPIALPTERNEKSNFGGNLLLFGVVLLFVVGALLLVLTMLAFLFGSIVYKGCEPLEDLTVFKDFLDQDKVMGYSLSETLLGTSVVQLKGYEVLMGCRANKTPWTVLKLSEVVPLENYIKYINFVGDLGQEFQDITSVDISRFHVLTKDLEDALSKVDAAALDAIDFQGIDEVVKQPPISFNIDNTLAEMETILGACSNPTKQNWLEHKLTLEAIKDTEVQAVENAMEALVLSADNLKQDVGITLDLTAVIRVTASAADSQIQNNMTGVLFQATVGLVGRIFSMLDSYASEIVYLIYNSLGNCKPLWNLYKSATVVLCQYGVDSLNGYWFSIGWGLLFFGPMIVVATKLSKHYKTMEEAVGYQDFDDVMGDNDAYNPSTTEGAQRNQMDSI